MAEIGTEWGFTDPCEVTSSPMTAREWEKWFHTQQAGVMIAFKLEDTINKYEPADFSLGKILVRKAYEWLI